MKIIFCGEPFEPRKVDSDYENEAACAEKAGFEIESVDLETLNREENAIRAVRLIKKSDQPEKVIYRGWMLKPSIYRRFYEALKTKNLILLNTPEEYKNCHYLSESYSIIEKFTPSTVFIKINEKIDFDEIYHKISIFENNPIVVKDFVKSRKHEWFEACYIPNASDNESVKKVVDKFLELQGEDLNGGLVFREFVKFQPLAAHSKSGMPLTKEYRIFFLNQRKIFSVEYWDEGEYKSLLPPDLLYEDVARKIGSNFFTMDIAQTDEGEWKIIEVGDGQVSGLPEKSDIQRFYQSLFDNLSE